jgi:hypothetical protein
MTTSAVLDDLIDALEEQSDSLFPFLDRETGEVVLISDESLSLAEAELEEIDLLPDWQKGEFELAVLIETADRYLRLPTQFDIHEWNIMADFCHQLRRDDHSGKATWCDPRRSCVSPLQGSDRDPQPMERMGWFSPPGIGGNRARLVQGRRHSPHRPATIGGARSMKKSSSAHLVSPAASR